MLNLFEHVSMIQTINLLVYAENGPRYTYGQMNKLHLLSEKTNVNECMNNVFRRFLNILSDGTLIFPSKLVLSLIHISEPTRPY